MAHKNDSNKSYTYQHFMLPTNFHMIRGFSDFISVSRKVGFTVTEMDQNKIILTTFSITTQVPT
jgi:hypothetical protein